MLTRSPRAAVALTGAALALAPASAAADPLLSGYGGPGSGEQDVLGSTLLPAGGGSTGGKPPSLRAARSVSLAPARGPRTAVPVTPSTAGNAGVARGGSTKPRRSAGRAGEPNPVTVRPSTSVPAPTASARQARPAGPGAATSAGALPVDGSDLALVLAVVVGLGGVGVASSRLARADEVPA